MKKEKGWITVWYRGNEEMGSEGYPSIEAAIGDLRKRLDGSLPKLTAQFGADNTVDFLAGHLTPGGHAPAEEDRVEIQIIREDRWDAHARRVAHSAENRPIPSAASILGSRGGKVGGKSKSAAKAEAARLNGKKGGRPRKAAEGA